jgi:phage tail-like protein
MTTRPRPDPYRSFNFIVHLDGVVLGGFSEVSGLSVEMNAVDYRAGSDTARSARRIPGQHKAGRLTLQRGAVDGAAFKQWQSAGAAARRRVTLVLYDEAHRAVRRWHLTSAWISKFTGPALKASGNDVAIESLELTHEGLATEE